MEERFREKGVLPGDELAVIEEFIEGEGVYQSDGDIRSETLGTSFFDLKKHSVNVNKRTRELVVPQDGDTVIAEVGSVVRRDARIDIFIIEGELIYPSFSGVIHISDISKSYVKNIDMALRSGDIIKARIVNTKNRLNQISMEGKQYGVIYAYCSRCGTFLKMNKHRLTCPNCDRTERRQTASTYGKEELV